MEQALHILHLEDDPRDAELIEICLRKAGLHCKIVSARDENAFRAGLLEGALDLVLSDFSVSGFDGMAALELTRQYQPEVPFIFLSGTIGEERAVLALKQGATDYVLKDRMGRLPAAIERALREAEEVAKRRRAEDDARTSAERFAHLLAHSPAVLYSMGIEQTAAVPVFVSENVTALLGFGVQDCLAPDWWRDHVHPEDREAAFSLFPTLLSQGAASSEYRLRGRDGKYFWIQDDVLLVRNGSSGPAKAVGSWTDVTERKRAQNELIAASRLAGKAEVATGILHDVRNVLTGINISFSMLRSKAKGLSVDGVQKLSDLVSKQTDLRNFLTEHEQGRKVPEYLEGLAARLSQEQQAITLELDRLTKGIEHIHQLISAQQAYAKVSGNKETVLLQEVIEQSISLNITQTGNSGWKIIKDFAPVPPVLIEKHKLLQILVNLVRNAKQACEQATGLEKVITLGLSRREDWICISVQDNGVGIPAENLQRLFEHGFTTKKDGHGFGLRSAAAAARELGGSLTAQSKGALCGAAFCLKLPAPTPTPAP